MITRRDFLKITVAGGALASLNNLEEAKATIYQVVPDTEFCYEGQRKIPIIAKTSIIVVGGSSTRNCYSRCCGKNRLRCILNRI